MKKRLEKKINFILSLLIILVLLPLLVTILFQRMQLLGLIAGMEEVQAQKDGAAGAYTPELEEKVLEIVANEISAGSSREAIKAQCVIARTNLYAAWETNMEEPKALDGVSLKALWGAEYETFYQKLQECVEETDGRVLVWKGDYIYAAYHAVSAGKTRAIAELYSETDMPYLTGVSCPADVTAEQYLSVFYLQPEALKEAEIVRRDGAGYVLEVNVGGEVCTGEEFRSRYALPSACFTIKELNGKIRIVTKGLGHGLGLSQHTAEQMAEVGKSYEEILEYFYPGALLADAKNVE